MSLIKPTILCTLGLAVVLCQPSAWAQQKLLPAQSEITFVSKQMGVPVEGRFKKFDAQISYEPSKPEATKVSFTIDTGSATIGSPETDVELPKANWFGAGKFPSATFVSSAVKSSGAGKLEVTGKLSIKGNAKDVVVPVSLSQAGAVTTASGQFTIKRLAFKVGEGEWADTSMVADEVVVKFKLALSGVAKL